MNTRIHIISGFLGAGKTTFIKKLLSENAFSNTPVLIENDYGSLGIDGDLMKQTGIMVAELNSGCICCTLEGSFTQALEQIYIQYEPEDIIIEPSGVGKLSEICRMVQQADFKCPLNIVKCVTVVDAKKFDYNAKYVSEYFYDQISSADTVVLSKVEKVNSDKLCEICKKIAEINPDAVIVNKSWKEPLKDSVYFTSPSLSPSKLFDVTDTSATESKMDSISFQVEQTYKEDEFIGMLNQLANEEICGKVFRAKGVIRTEKGLEQIDYVSGDIQIVESNLDVTGKLLVIGKELKKENLYKVFRIPVRWMAPKIGKRRKKYV